MNIIKLSEVYTICLNKYRKTRIILIAKKKLLLHFSIFTVNFATLIKCLEAIRLRNMNLFIKVN